MSASTRTASREIVVRPPGRWSALRLDDLWAFRELLYFITKRELQIRYKQSFFGVSWAILQPLALAYLFALFFGQLAGVSSEGVAYPVFALTALVPWIFVSSGVGQSALSLVSDSNLISKVYFARLVLPVGRILALSVDLAVSLAVLGLFLVVYDQPLRPTALAVPAFVVLAAVTAFGFGVLLAALNVQYRDVTVAVPLVLQLWLFVSPVAYSGSLVTGGWRYLYAVNPMVGVIDGMRWALLGTREPDPEVLAVSILSALVLAFGGVLYFRRTERFFADVI